MLLCLGVLFAKQRFCFYLKGKISLGGAWMEITEPFTKGRILCFEKCQVVPNVHGACFYGSNGLSLQVPRDLGCCGFRDYTAQNPLVRIHSC